MRILFLFFIFMSFSIAQSDDWLTYYEKSGYAETPRYTETIEYCKKLADASPLISYQTFGISPQGRELPLLVVNKNGHFTSKEVRKGNQVVFYIQAGIHSGECDGKDAGLMLIRDLVIHKKYPGLLDNVTLLFNPIFSVDGHERFGAYNRANQNGPKEMGWRVTAQNLNLNRDYLKADAPEMQAMLRLYNEWLPEFFADCHVTDGADYQYAVTYKIELHGIQDAGIIDWTKTSYLPELQTRMKADGFPIIEYVSFRKRHDPYSGMGTWATPPRLSDGYTAIHNRPGLLIETHMFKDYHTRVSGTYEILKHTIEILNQEAQTLRGKIFKADLYATSDLFRKNPFTLNYQSSSDSTMIDFLGYEYQKIKSDLTGGDWYRYDSDKPRTFRIPFFNHMKPDKQVELPEAYIIPAEWQSVIERLSWHGISFRRLKKAAELEISSYRFEDVSWQKQPYEGRQIAQFKTKKITEERVFPAGSVVIDMNQRTAKVIANILEPDARDSFVYWGFFNAIFERKEYVESYVMEEYARMMLASDPNLKSEFEHKIQSDSTFAADPSQILMWFYQKSPYWDDHINRYPVGRIMDRKILSTLEL